MGLRTGVEPAVTRLKVSWLNLSPTGAIEWDPPSWVRHFRELLQNVAPGDFLDIGRLSKGKVSPSPSTPRISFPSLVEDPMIGGAGRYRTCITGYRLGSVLRELPRREGSETGGADGSRTRIFRIDNPAFSPVELPHLKKAGETTLLDSRPLAGVPTAVRGDRCLRACPRRSISGSQRRKRP